MNPETYNQFLRFKNKEFLTENELNLADDYIYGFLLCDYDHLEMYAYSNCTTKCRIVLEFKKENNFEIKTKLGEAICQNKLVNFIEDPNHRMPNCYCGSTYGGIKFE